MTTVIKVENVSKQYHLGSIGTSTLRGDLQRWWSSVRGLPDPTLMIGQENNLKTEVKVKAKAKVKRLTPSTLPSTSVASTSDDFVWALKDINFEVKQGEVLGIIGKNGAGKSTLLKLLSRVTAPTLGSIKVKGRIASLLEVGTGFHPELTGRENIFLNGAILGMTKTEIRNKFDEIVDFAGVTKYIDTPVKRYSSGMFVRLAFAVAAHLEPEILIVDEVLAVGDAEFQKKAIGKMQDVSRNDGRTVLFVSHNMVGVKNLCKNGILLKNGNIHFTGEISDVVDSYLAEEIIKGLINYHWTFEEAPGFEKIRIKSAYVQFEGNFLTVKTAFDIVTEFWNLEEGFSINVSMHLFDKVGTCVFVCVTENKPLSRGLHRVVFHIPANLMNDGGYYVSNMFVSKASMYFFHERAIVFDIIENREMYDWHGKWSGTIRPTFIMNDFQLIERL